MKAKSPDIRKKYTNYAWIAMGDAVVMLIEQKRRHCLSYWARKLFYKVWQDGAWQTVDAVLKDEEAIYGHKHP